ncbi:hypothetical protein AKJ16_DCAP12817, partial [Drosera capensis]
FSFSWQESGSHENQGYQKSTQLYLLLEDPLSDHLSSIEDAPSKQNNLEMLIWAIRHIPVMLFEEQKVNQDYCMLLSLPSCSGVDLRFKLTYAGDVMPFSLHHVQLLRLWDSRVWYWAFELDLTVVICERDRAYKLFNHEPYLCLALIQLYTNWVHEF